MTALVTVLCLAGYLLGYFVYARFLARRIFVIDPSAPTPAHLLRDDVDMSRRDGSSCSDTTSHRLPAWPRCWGRRWR